MVGRCGPGRLSAGRIETGALIWCERWPPLCVCVWHDAAPRGEDLSNHDVPVARLGSSPDVPARGRAARPGETRNRQ